MSVFVVTADNLQFILDLPPDSPICLVPNESALRRIDATCLQKLVCTRDYRNAEKKVVEEILEKAISKCRFDAIPNIVRYCDARGVGLRPIDVTVPHPTFAAALLQKEQIHAVAQAFLDLLQIPLCWRWGTKRPPAREPTHQASATATLHSVREGKPVQHELPSDAEGDLFPFEPGYGSSTQNFYF